MIPQEIEHLDFDPYSVAETHERMRLELAGLTEALAGRVAAAMLGMAEAMRGFEREWRRAERRAELRRKRERKRRRQQAGCRR